MQPCEEKLRRLESCETSAARLKLTEKALRAARATVSHQEYERMLGYNEQAQAQSENSRLELEHHIAQHHC